MRKFAFGELVAVLRAIDAELTSPVRVIVIGGSAIVLGGYNSLHTTTDIDVLPVSDRAFWEAVDRSRAKLAGAVSVSGVAITSPPLNFEDRLVDVPISDLEHLTVLIPEPHDLAILKVVRGEAHDYQAVEDVHRQDPLDLRTLVERYKETLDQIIGPPGRFRLNFLSMVGRLFGEDVADELEPTLPSLGL